MDEPDWAHILEFLYERGESHSADFHRISPDNRMVLETGLDPITVEEAILFLEEQGLIKVEETGHMDLDEYNDPINPTSKKIKLEREGFQVAHDREQASRQEETNNEIGNFTLALVFVGILQTAAAVITPDDTIEAIAILGGLLVVLGGVLYWSKN